MAQIPCYPCETCRPESRHSACSKD